MRARAGAEQAVEPRRGVRLDVPVLPARPFIKNGKVGPDVTNAERMRDFRRRFDLNTEAAGRVFGLTARAIEDIEQGRRRVDDRVLELALKNIKKVDVEG